MTKKIHNMLKDGHLIRGLNANEHDNRLNCLDHDEGQYWLDLREIWQKKKR